MRVAVIFRGVSGAAVMATAASTDKLSSGKRAMGAMVFGRGRRFRYFPVGVVSEEVDVFIEGDRGEGKVKVFGQPPRWSRDTCEDFVVICRGELKVFNGTMCVGSSNHTATFFCLDRVITFEVGVFVWEGL